MNERTLYSNSGSVSKCSKKWSLRTKKKNRKGRRKRREQINSFPQVCLEHWKTSGSQTSLEYSIIVYPTMRIPRKFYTKIQLHQFYCCWSISITRNPSTHHNLTNFSIMKKKKLQQLKINLSNKKLSSKRWLKRKTTHLESKDFKNKKAQWKQCWGHLNHITEYLSCRV
jgi:hypothetical protein